MLLGYQAARRLLLTTDEEERSIIQAMTAAAREIQQQLDLSRANMIANAVGKMLGG